MKETVILDTDSELEESTEIDEIEYAEELETKLENKPSFNLIIEKNENVSNKKNELNIVENKLLDNKSTGANDNNSTNNNNKEKNEDICLNKPNIVKLPCCLKYLENEKAKFTLDLLKYTKNIAKMNVIQKKFNIKIYKEDIRTLKKSNWLNDRIINFYFQFFADEKITILSTFFYTHLKQKGFESVEYYIEKLTDFIFIPVHLTNHWIFVLINNRKHHIHTFDSLLGERKSVAGAIRQFLEKKFFQGRTIYQEYMQVKIPRQFNGYDCGVYVIYYAKKIFECKNNNIKVDFVNRTINTEKFRMIITHEIRVGKMLYQISDIEHYGK